MPSLPERLSADLLVARKARDGVAVSALRTTLAALSNAEAAPVVESSSAEPPAIGLVEHDRLVLTPDDHHRILREQIAQRIEAAREYDDVDQRAAAAAVRAEVTVLEAYLP